MITLTISAFVPSPWLGGEMGPTLRFLATHLRHDRWEPLMGRRGDMCISKVAEWIDKHNCQYRGGKTLLRAVPHEDPRGPIAL